MRKADECGWCGKVSLSLLSTFMNEKIEWYSGALRMIRKNGNYPYFLIKFSHRHFPEKMVV